MKSRTCLRCGSDFTCPDTHGRQVYCSARCRRAAYYRQGHPVPPVKQCEWCGRSYQPLERDQKYCGRSCSMKHLNSVRNPPPPPSECEWCKAGYQPSHNGQRFCSISCGQKAKHARYRAEKAANNPLAKCEQCGAEFRPRRVTHIFCSRSCATRHFAQERHANSLAASTGMKACRVCGETKPLEVFPKHKGNLDGHAGRCSQCREDRTRELNANGPRIVRTEKECRRCGRVLPCTAEHFPVSNSSIDGFDGQCRECKSERSRERWQNNAGGVREKARAYGFAARLVLLKAYGGDPPRCACCGEDRREFLSIDHVDGNGAAHRRELRDQGTSIDVWAKRNGYPPVLQVLCMNCNTAQAWWGYCPHQKEREEAGRPSAIALPPFV